MKGSGELDANAFKELLDSKGYIGNPVQINFHINKRDTVKFNFQDGGILTCNYDLGSLRLIELSRKNKLLKRLIPEGKPTNNAHFDDILSGAEGKNIVIPGEKYEIWERLPSIDKLNDFLKFSKDLPLKLIETKYGLQARLHVFFQEKYHLSFRFERNATKPAIYKSGEEKLLYIP